jgi:class 3 adenylate cyclase
MERGLKNNVEGGDVVIEIGWRCTLALALVDLGDQGSAKPHVERAIELIMSDEDWRGCAGHVHLAEAAYYAALGSLDRAFDGFERAVETCRKYSLFWLEADALHRWGRVFLDAGRPEQALEKLNAALDVYTSISAAPVWSEPVLADKMRAQGVDAAASPASSIEAVTFALQHDRPSIEALPSRNGAVTIVFTDIEGSTPMAQRLGDQAWMSLLRDHNRVVREQVLAHRGTEVKSEGDGFMLAFARPEDALGCAAAIQRAFADNEIKVRIGLHTGEAIEEDGDFFGQTVILASRIADRARGGEILVSEAVANAVADDSFDEGTEAELKGLLGSYRVHRAAWN